MHLLATILRHPNIPAQGRTILREAVRGIIMDGQKILMVYSPVNGDYKFPGGGMEPGETHETALLREIREETGTHAEILRPFGKVLEYDIPAETDFDIFKMTSYYYWCKIGAETSAQSLDTYEADLGFTPVWITLEEAIRQNAIVLQQPTHTQPLWTQRELEVLKQIQISTRKTRTKQNLTEN